MNEAGILYKVLIIDDEILVIQFLENLICWEAAGCKVVGTASTGRRALQLARELQPDIIFMDIKMPGTDGLTLSRKILGEICRAEIIILTAYADFEFAQEALKIGIRDYLLKNQVDERTLGRALEQAIEVIKRKEQLYAWQIEQWMKRGWDNGIQEKPPEEIGDITGTFRILLIKQQTLFGKSVRANDRKAETCRLSEDIVGSADIDSGCLLLVKTENGRSESHKREVYQRVGIQQLQIMRDTGSWIGIYSKSFSDIKMYQEICQALRNMQGRTFFMRHFLVFPEEYEKMILHRPTWSECPGEYLKKTILKTGKIEKAFREVMKAWEPDFLMEESDLISLIGLEKEDLPDLPEKIRNCGTFSELARNEDLLREYLCRKSNLILCEHSRKVHQTIVYIQEHFKEDINSSVIADVLQMSDGYLRKIFKQETGVTIKGYLMDYRIKRAQELLQSGKYNISEIAVLCGFKTSQHFSTVFKKFTGKSPGVFLYGEQERRERSVYE